MKKIPKEHDLSSLLGKYPTDKKEKKLDWVNVGILLTCFLMWCIIVTVVATLTTIVFEWMNN